MLYAAENPHGGDIYGRKILLDYSANTNPYGTPEGVLEAVRDCLSDLHHYPDPYCRDLAAAIAAHEGLPRDYILCGNGAADLIYGFCRALRPGKALMTAPTFSEYALGLSDCEIVRYELREENSFDLTEAFLPFLESTSPDAVFLCTPNNPTGRLIAPSLLERILCVTRKRGIRLFLDECFLDLSTGAQTMKGYLRENPQLLILRAFTKSYGMAGLRLGYCLSSDAELLAAMAAQSQPWNVSIPAQRAGIAALGEGAFLEKTRRTVEAERAWLLDALKGLGLRSNPSCANFILFHGPLDLKEKLLAEGIAIRDCGNYFGLGPGWYRIAVRLHHQNEALMEALGRSVGKD